MIADIGATLHHLPMSPYDMDIAEVIRWHARAISRYKTMNGIK